MTSLLPFIYTWRCECNFETINFDLKFPRFIAWIYFLISWFNSHLSITTNVQKPNAQHEKRPLFFPSAWCTKPILPHLFYSCSSSSSTTCFFYPISILAWSPASQIQHHLRKCPFILHRFLILLPFTLQYSFASSRSLSLCNIVYIQMYALFKMKWIWIEASGRMIKMKELFFLIFRKLITYSMMTVTIDGSNIHVAFSSSIEIRNEINFGRVV